MLRQHGFDRLEEWLVTAATETETAERLRTLAQEDDAVVLLTSRKQMNRWQAELDQLGIHWQLLQLVVSVLDGMLPKYREVYNLLEDEASRQAYTYGLSSRFKLLPDLALRDVYCGDAYFALPEMRMFSADEVFVDCGAYVGDTVEEYLRCCGGMFGKVVAFEPGAVQYTAMRKRFARLRDEWALADDQLIAVRAGAGEHSSRAIMTNGSYGGGLTETHVVLDEDADDENAVDIVALDEVLKGQRVDFIKADIEGFEMEMLRGAKRLIQEQHPRLAICLYHKLTDPYEIPLYLKELVPEYHFKVRHHGMAFVEMVLYAYCE